MTKSKSACWLSVSTAAAVVISLSAAPPALSSPPPMPPQVVVARQLPLPGSTLTRPFQVGEKNWTPGHRGVDLAGAPDQTVLAAADGTVRWVGVINGVPGLSILHGDGTISTYQPVTALVATGQGLKAGSVIGTLQPGHPGCATDTCLHWGIRSGKKYLDPMLWLGGQVIKVRLLPVGSRPKPLSSTSEQIEVGETVPVMPSDGSGP